MTDITCEGCYHAKKDSSCGNDQECSLCIRNASLMSSRTLEKEIEIDGIKFKAPMDMYIAKDRMKYEDYMRTKKIIEAMRLSKPEEPKAPDPINPFIWPTYPTYPYHPEYPIYWSEWIKYRMSSGAK